MMNDILKEQKVLIYDIETNGVDTKTSKMVFFGAYSYVTDKYYYLNAYNNEDKQKIQELIQQHVTLVGFNSNYFDKPIIENNGISWNTGESITKKCVRKRDIDLYDVLTTKKKASLMATPKGEMLNDVAINYKLKTICECLCFDVAKGDIDYNIFKQNSWNHEELQEIYMYLHLDIELTRQLFEYVLDYFKPFSEYISEYDYKTFKHITSSPGSYTYSAICHLTNTPKQWGEVKEKPVNNGGYVLEPQKDFAKDVVYFDFSSLYPMIFIQNNLFSSTCKCCKASERFKGNDLFTLKGSYCNKTQGNIEKTLKLLYKRRTEYKKQNDPRQYAIKIMINSLYGITGSPIFTGVYNLNVSGDCTIIGRSITKKAIDMFNTHGLNVVYADTDSCFIELDSHNIDYAQKVADLIVLEVQKYFAFPFKDFKFKVDGVFNKVRFESKKKYFGITPEGDLKLTGISIKRKDVSKLGKLVFQDIKKDLIKSEFLKLSKEHVLNLMKQKVNNDITICQQIYSVNKPEDYSNKTSIQYQISSELGEGDHVLIPNTKLGRIGKQKKYCSPALARKFLKIEDIILTKTINELKSFY